MTLTQRFTPIPTPVSLSEGRTDVSQSPSIGRCDRVISDLNLGHYSKVISTFWWGWSTSLTNERFQWDDRHHLILSKHTTSKNPPACMWHSSIDNRQLFHMCTCSLNPQGWVPHIPTDKVDTQQQRLSIHGSVHIQNEKEYAKLYNKTSTTHNFLWWRRCEVPTPTRLSKLFPDTWGNTLINAHVFDVERALIITTRSN